MIFIFTQDNYVMCALDGPHDFPLALERRKFLFELDVIISQEPVLGTINPLLPQKKRDEIYDAFRTARDKWNIVRVATIEKLCKGIKQENRYLHGNQECLDEAFIQHLINNHGFKPVHYYQDQINYERGQDPLNLQEKSGNFYLSYLDADAMLEAFQLALIHGKDEISTQLYRYIIKKHPDLADKYPEFN